MAMDHDFWHENIRVQIQQQGKYSPGVSKKVSAAKQCGVMLLFILATDL